MILNKTCVVLDKPIYVGVTVLELAKLHMYEFHYGEMLPRYNSDVQLCYTDTDSFLYYIKTPDVYTDIREKMIHLFDSSDYPQPNPYNIPSVNEKVLGLMKDETAGDPITKFVGLRAKTYFYATKGHRTSKKTKGIKRQNGLRVDDFEASLFDKKIVSVEQLSIRSREHTVTTDRLVKIALDPHDDKRCILSCGIHTLPWGHYRIEQDVSPKCDKCL